MVGCAYNAHYKCFYEDGFNSSFDGYNVVTITVPDTFSTATGEFGCQKGDIPMFKMCLYPPPGKIFLSSKILFKNEQKTAASNG